MRQILARADEVIESNDWESWFDVVTESASETVGAWLPERGVELECDLADPAIAPSRVNLRSPARPAFVS
jgi:hypothetical protein